MSSLEAEIKYIGTLEAQRVEQIRILKSVEVRDTALRYEIKSRKAALAEPLPVEPLPMEPEFGQEVDFEEISPFKTPGNGRPNTVDSAYRILGPSSVANHSGTPGCAPCTPGSPTKSRESFVSPGAVFVDTHANAMFAAFRFGLRRFVVTKRNTL